MSKLFSDQTYKTKGIIKVVTTIFFLILFFLIWLLFGEINLLKFNWFFTPKTDASEEYEWLRSGAINLLILAIWIPCLILPIIFFVFAKWIFKFANYDLLPYIVLTIVFALSLWLTGFIPYNDNNSNWIIFARFIIVITTIIFFTFLTIKITNVFLLKSQSSATLYEAIKKDYIDVNKVKNENELITGKQKRNKEKDYIKI